MNGIEIEWDGGQWSVYVVLNGQSIFVGIGRDGLNKALTRLAHHVGVKVPEMLERLRDRLRILTQLAELSGPDVGLHPGSSVRLNADAGQMALGVPAGGRNGPSSIEDVVNALRSARSSKLTI